jgi:hypothetical protein
MSITSNEGFWEEDVANTIFTLIHDANNIRAIMNAKVRAPKNDALFDVRGKKLKLVPAVKEMANYSTIQQTEIIGKIIMEGQPGHEMLCQMAAKENKKLAAWYCAIRNPAMLEVIDENREEAIFRQCCPNTSRQLLSSVPQESTLNKQGLYENQIDAMKKYVLDNDALINRLTIKLEILKVQVAESQAHLQPDFISSSSKFLSSINDCIYIIPETINEDRNKIMAQLRKTRNEAKETQKVQALKGDLLVSGIVSYVDIPPQKSMDQLVIGNKKDFGVNTDHVRKDSKGTNTEAIDPIVKPDVEDSKFGISWGKRINVTPLDRAKDNWIKMGVSPEIDALRLNDLETEFWRIMHNGYSIEWKATTFEKKMACKEMIMAMWRTVRLNILNGDLNDKRGKELYKRIKDNCKRMFYASLGEFED